VEEGDQENKVVLFFQIKDAINNAILFFCEITIEEYVPE
jgi:hypothetical protein